MMKPPPPFTRFSRNARMLPTNLGAGFEGPFPAPHSNQSAGFTLLYHCRFIRSEIYAYCTQFCCIVSFHRLHDKRLPGALKHAHTQHTQHIYNAKYSASQLQFLYAYAANGTSAFHKVLYQAQHLPPAFIPEAANTFPILVQIKPNHFCALPCNLMHHT
jgi:hypothetical protein